MQRKYMILPNVAVLVCSVMLFHGSFLSGHITWIGSLLILSPLLPLMYCLLGLMPRYVRYFAALLNAILFFNVGYAFFGTMSMLLKRGEIEVFYIIALDVLWACSLGMVFLRARKMNAICALLLNGILCTLGLLGLYVRAASGWTPWMTALLFGVLISVSGLNAYLLVTAKQPEPTQ